MRFLEDDLKKIQMKFYEVLCSMVLRNARDQVKKQPTLPVLLDDGEWIVPYYGIDTQVTNVKLPTLNEIKESFNNEKFFPLYFKKGRVCSGCLFELRDEKGKPLLIVYACSLSAAIGFYKYEIRIDDFLSYNGYDFLNNAKFIEKENKIEALMYEYLKTIHN